MDDFALNPLLFEMANEVVEVMQVDDDHPSPTELAASDDEQANQNDNMEVKLEKRKREEGEGLDAGIGSPLPAPAAPTVPSEDDADLESPNKRPSRGSEPPLSASEIRNLLCGHVSEMRDAWRSFQTRLDTVEGQQVAHSLELGTLGTRTTVLEKETHALKNKQTQVSKSMDELALEVKNMKVQMGELQDKSKQAPHRPAQPAGAAPADPWGDYIRRRGQQQLQPQHPAAHSRADQPGSSNSVPDRNETLTEDEKKTLVIGGWLRDTKRAVIEQEAQQVLSLEGIKHLIDSDKLQIYGPRRSVGMLKFELRQDEEVEDLRNRMWDTVKFLAQLN